MNTMSNNAVSGRFVTFAGERFYKIANVDQMPVFFISVVSDSDHWLFASSNGGITAGRVSAETALFPYIPVDKVYESTAHTGSKTVLRVQSGDTVCYWEPFNEAHNGRYNIQRHLYKNVLGNKLCFEEINTDLQLVFRYTWMSSDAYGFVRDCQLENLSEQRVSVELIDGLLNIMPAGVPRAIQSDSSNLADAYKWTGVDKESGLACYTLYSGITDKPEPYELLGANAVFCLGLDNVDILLSEQQLGRFRAGQPVQPESYTRGVRGAYLISTRLSLKPQDSVNWQLVANIEQSQADAARLQLLLQDKAALQQLVMQSVAAGSDELAQIMGGMDGLQLTAEETVSVHHYANVLFNGMRGGIFDQQYQIDTADFCKAVKHFNQSVFAANRALLADLPPKTDFRDLMALVKQQGDTQLERLCYEYLPLTFGRRHGDPSRPWNQFAIKLKDKGGNRLLSYQGNWRDIFQNWEALLFSYPTFIENSIAKFVNASTIDGYNPYRITKEGIDWETEEADDPWSFIGYWGDHQIIYLLKLLELSNAFHPEQLKRLLSQPVFCYANVPYRIKPFVALLENPKDTIVYDVELAEQIERCVERIGADGKLLLTDNEQVYQVGLLEKLLIPLLSKLSNLVPGGGIWLNTQRPEWNDANNALVGQGVSMVTLYYLRRYICFLQDLLQGTAAPMQLSAEVSRWLMQTADILSGNRDLFAAGDMDNSQRFSILEQLGQAAAEYRLAVYEQEGFSGQSTQNIGVVHHLLADALLAVDHSIVLNQRTDGLYHAYNLLDLQPGSVGVNYLYPMLEGQVSALSSGALTPQQAIDVLAALFATDLYRADQKTFMLYPDRKVPGFLERNVVPATQVESNGLLTQMLAAGDERILLRDVAGVYRFNADIINLAALDERLDAVLPEYTSDLAAERARLHDLHEVVFNHKAFTGRSGGMFGFEGLGSIYWHMVSKLLLATQEMFFTALDQGVKANVSQQLGHYYYLVREGIGFNKTPAEYGAFPTDPYSHTPGHAGAQQPGMTGQVKEEVLTRFGELGIRVSGGQLSFEPALLRCCEFISEEKPFRYLDVADTWQELTVSAHSLAFTWCQVLIVYELSESEGLEILWEDGQQQVLPESVLPTKLSAEIFERSGKIKQITLRIRQQTLFVDPVSG